MIKRMEQIISKDVGMNIEGIRCSSWSTLEKQKKNFLEQPFRPKEMFIVGGNINLAENREMGKILLEIRSIVREVAFKIACLLKHMKNV